MNKDLEYIEIETGESPVASVIWLHGLGASGDDFASVVPHLNLPQDLPVRFIFPHAPEIAVTINGGYYMPAWYDILELGLERKFNHNQLQASSDAVVTLIENEQKRGIDSSSILLAGFSQGGAVVYHCGLSYHKPLAGILALSTYFATSQTTEVHPANQDIPIEIYHGTADDMVPESMGLAARDALFKRGFEPAYQTYAIGHEVCMEEIQDISEAMQSLLRQR